MIASDTMEATQMNVDEPPRINVKRASLPSSEVVASVRSARSANGNGTVTRSEVVGSPRSARSEAASQNSTIERNSPRNMESDARSERTVDVANIDVSTVEANSGRATGHKLRPGGKEERFIGTKFGRCCTAVAEWQLPGSYNYRRLYLGLSLVLNIVAIGLLIPPFIAISQDTDQVQSFHWSSFAVKGAYSGSGVEYVFALKGFIYRYIQNNAEVVDEVETVEAYWQYKVGGPCVFLGETCDACESTAQTSLILLGLGFAMSCIVIAAVIARLVLKFDRVYLKWVAVFVQGCGAFPMLVLCLGIWVGGCMSQYPKTYKISNTVYATVSEFGPSWIFIFIATLLLPFCALLNITVPTEGQEKHRTLREDGENDTDAEHQMEFSNSFGGTIPMQSRNPEPAEEAPPNRAYSARSLASTVVGERGPTQGDAAYSEQERFGREGTWTDFRFPGLPGNGVPERKVSIASTRRASDALSRMGSLHRMGSGISAAGDRTVEMESTPRRQNIQPQSAVLLRSPPQPIDLRNQVSLRRESTASTDKGLPPTIPKGQRRRASSASSAGGGMAGLALPPIGIRKPSLASTIKADGEEESGTARQSPREALSRNSHLDPDLSSGQLTGSATVAERDMLRCESKSGWTETGAHTPGWASPPQYEPK